MVIALGILLIVLKLAHIIGWSWWLVTLPLWIIPATYLSIVGAFIVGVFSWVLGSIGWDVHKRTRLKRGGRYDT